MLIFLLSIRVALSAVLGLAGFSKLFDRRGFEDSLSGFRVPDRLIDFLVWGVPVTEIGLALGLLTSRAAALSSIGATALFTIFTILVAVNVRQGNEIACRCFGNLTTGTIDWKTVARNVFLSALAILLVITRPIQAQITLAGWLDNLSAGEHILFFAQLATLVLFAVVLNLILRIQKRVETLADKFAELSKAKAKEEKSEQEVQDPTKRPGLFSPNRGLPIGAPAPNFSLRSLDDEELTLDHLLAQGNPTLLTFIGPDCPPCEALLPRLERWDSECSGKLQIALISSGTSEDHAFALATTDIQRVMDNGSIVHKAYDANWTPSAVLISSRGTVNSHLANGSAAVESLFHHALENAVQPWLASAPHLDAEARPEDTHPGLGDEAPAFSLQNLDGKRLRLGDFRGLKVLLLFWNASCEFCKDMAKDILKFEAEAPSNAPQLLIITSSSGRAVKRAGFRSAVLFARNTGVSLKFGVLGTPSGVLIDEEGKIASEVQERATAIMALLRPRAASETD